MSGLPPTTIFAPLGLDLSPFGTASTIGGTIARHPGSTNRQIGTLPVAEVTVSEDHEDILTITRHPVAWGAAISDHAFKEPAEVRVRVGWSDGYTGGDASTIYQQVIQLQAARQPFNVFTGKRVYENMLVADVRTATNSGTEYSFIADIVLRQVIIVSTQTLPGGTSQNINNLGDPPSNTPTNQTGDISTVPAGITYDDLSQAVFGTG